MKHDSKQTLFSPQKINVIISRCFIEEWTIIYTFYLLEQKIWKVLNSENKNYNIIDITKFYDREINFSKITQQEYQQILSKAYSKMVETVNLLHNYKIALFFINDVSYNLFFQTYYVKLKNKNAKIVLWRDDLFAFNQKHYTCMEDYNCKFISPKLDKSNLLLTPSIKYFENISSQYMEKTKFLSYSIDNELFDRFNVKFEHKINKILISGEYRHFCYEKRAYLINNKDKSLFETVKRPPNKSDMFPVVNCKYTINQYKTPENGMTNYYKTMSQYKACIMILALYPLDFVLGKFVEIFNTNSLAVLDYTPELEKRFTLEIFDDYIPILYSINNDKQIDQDRSYYTKYMNSLCIYEKIVSNGVSKIRNSCSLDITQTKLLNYIGELFVTNSQKEIKYVYDQNETYCIPNSSFELFNIYFYNKPLPDNLVIYDSDISLQLLNKKTSKAQYVTITNSENEKFVSNYISELVGITVEQKTVADIYEPVLCICYDQKYISFLKNVKTKYIICISYEQKDYTWTSYNPHNSYVIYINLTDRWLLSDKLSYVFRKIMNKKIDITEIEIDSIVEKMGKSAPNKENNKEETNIYKYNLMDLVKNASNTDDGDGDDDITEDEVQFYYKKFYYFGEFGFFNTTIVGKLKLLNEPIVLLTYPDYAKIIRLCNMDNILVQTTELQKNREYHNTSGIQPPEGYMDLAKYLKAEKELDITINKTMLTQPITYYSDKYEKKHTDKKYIAIFPRNRPGKFSSRNFPSDLITKMLESIKKYTSDNYELVVVGNETEINTEWCNTYKCQLVTDIREQVYLFNNNIQLLVAPDSGFIDFAKNCGCRCIVLMFSSPPISYHSTFNPFNSVFRQISYAKNYTEFEYFLQNINTYSINKINDDTKNLLHKSNVSSSKTVVYGKSVPNSASLLKHARKQQQQQGIIRTTR